MTKIEKNAALPPTLLGFYRKNFFRYYGRQQILWSVIMVVTLSVSYVFQPMYMKIFAGFLEKFMVDSTPDLMQSFVIHVIVGIVIMLAINFGYYVYTAIDARINPQMSNKISEDLFDYAYNQSVGFYTETMPGKMLNQINLIAGGLRSIYKPIFGHMIAILVAVGVSFTIVLTMNLWVAGVLIFGTTFRILWSLYRRKRIATTSKEKSEMNSEINGKLTDGLSNFMIVKLFAGVKTEKEKIAPVRLENVTKEQKSNRQMNYFWILPSFVEDVSTIVILFILGLLFAAGQIQFAEAIFAITAYAMISDRIWDFVYTLPGILDSYSMSATAYRDLVQPIAVMDADNAPNLAVTSAEVDIRNVSFKYKSKQVLDDFSLKIAPGEKVGLVGSSGAGKTTLVNLLMRFYDPNEGGIFIDNQNIREVTQDSLRENIAFIPQEPTMFNRTLRENIGYGKPDASDEEIREAAKFAQADTFIMEADKQYNSMVGDRGIKLSGGQKQRIAIARAFLKNAPILILDEATSALDSETEEAIQQSFEKLSQGRTTIAIAHRLSTLRNMDRIVVIDDGKIVEQGIHVALLRKGGVYARLWEMQSGGFLRE